MMKALACMMLVMPSWAQAPGLAPLGVEAKQAVPAEPGIRVVPASDLAVDKHLSKSSYPVLARMGHVKGTIRVRMVVGPDGIVEGVKALEGPPMLHKAAEAALRTYKFKPVMSQGKGTRVVSDVDVPFTLSEDPANQPETPVTGFVLHAEASVQGGAIELNHGFVEKETLIRLAKLGLVARDPATADPATTLDLTLRVQVAPGSGHSVIHQLVARASLLADQKLEENEPGKPARVYFFRRIAGQTGEEGTQETVQLSLDQVMEFLSPSAGDGLPNLASYLDDAGKPIAGTVGWVPGTPLKTVNFGWSQMKVRYQPQPPSYPEEAKMARIQGTVVVEIMVDPTGKPKYASAVEGPAQLLATAVQYALAWRFEPAMLDGIPQTARFKLTMPFHLH